MVEKRSFFWVGILAILLLSVPYLIASLEGNDQWVFGGFLLNPIDGNSYLAKMQQGFQGNWKFVLPYTADPGEGAFLFILYISLGHIARIFSLPLIWVFHTFRLICAVFLIYSIWRLAKVLVSDKADRILVFCLAVFGSGMGWIGVLVGQFTSDFWVAEAYPFLSMYANPHFPLGLGLLILLLLPGKYRMFRYLFLGLALSVVQPFAIVIAIIIIGVMTILEISQLQNFGIAYLRKSANLPKLIGVGLSGGLVLIYQYYSILTDPILLLWNEQNITTPPLLLDFILAFSPVMMLAVFGIKESIKSDFGKILLIWTISSVLLVLIPWNLQRRFLTGIYVPLAGMAFLGLKHLVTRYKFNLRTGTWILFILVIPTNLIILITGIQASLVQDRNVYYSTDLEGGFEWIRTNTDFGDLILTDEKTGLLVPAQTGRRVIYGHPFETINADSERHFIYSIFNEPMDEDILLTKLEPRNIDYILVQKDSEFVNIGVLINGSYTISYENSKIIIFTNEGLSE